MLSDFGSVYLQCVALLFVLKQVHLLGTYVMSALVRKTCSFEMHFFCSSDMKQREA